MRTFSFFFGMAHHYMQDTGPVNSSFRNVNWNVRTHIADPPARALLAGREQPLGKP